MKIGIRKSGLLLLFVNTALFAEVIDVNPDQLEQMLRDQDALVIDVRTPGEWKETGTIPSSRTLMYFDEEGNSDSQQWLAQLNQIKKPGQRVVLVCHSGGRSSKVAEFLDQEVGMAQVFNLEEGISAWIEHGKRTEPCQDESCK